MNHESVLLELMKKDGLFTGSKDDDKQYEMGDRVGQAGGRIRLKKLNIPIKNLHIRDKDLGQGESRTAGELPPDSSKVPSVERRPELSEKVRSAWLGLGAAKSPEKASSHICPLPHCQQSTGTRFAFLEHLMKDHFWDNLDRDFGPGNLPGLDMC